MDLVLRSSCLDGEPLQPSTFPSQRLPDHKSNTPRRSVAADLHTEQTSLILTSIKRRSKAPEQRRNGPCAEIFLFGRRTTTTIHLPITASSRPQIKHTQAFSCCRASDRSSSAGTFSRNLTMKLVPVVVLLLLASVLTSCRKPIRPVDCNAIHQQDTSLPSGLYTIYPLGERSAVQVYCDMDSEGGGWTVFQRRVDGTVNFYRPWNYYKFGFGSAAGEYWLGLDNIHYLTQNQETELLVDMEDFEGSTAFARYSSFSVDDECAGYLLQVSGFTDGGAGDSMANSNGQKFSTLDKDQDASEDKHCARKHLGAFWYNECFATNPNGIYLWGADNTHYGIGVEWYFWKGNGYSLKAISMKIRPVQ